MQEIEAGEQFGDMALQITNEQQGGISLLSEMLFFSYSLEKILEAVTAAAEEKNIDRFSPIVEGLQDNSVQLQVSKSFLTNFCNR